MQVPVAPCSTSGRSGLLSSGTSRCRPSRATLRTRSKLRPARAVAEPPVLPFKQDAEHLQQWHPHSWRSLPVHQQPNYPDPEAVKKAVSELEQLPPLVFAGECRNLQARLAKCASGEAFWLQGAALKIPRY